MNRRDMLRTMLGTAIAAVLPAPKAVEIAHKGFIDQVVDMWEYRDAAMYNSHDLYRVALVAAYEPQNIPAGARVISSEAWKSLRGTHILTE